MSKTVHINSSQQFNNLLQTSTIVVADFYADWCGPCKQISPIFEQLSASLSRPNKITFAKINIDNQQQIAQEYAVRAVPTFIIFRNSQIVQNLAGAGGKQLDAAIRNIAQEADRMDAGTASSGEGSSGKFWLGASLPRNYEDVTSQVDIRALELANFEASKGSARVLVAANKPKDDDDKDYVESDTDEQLMMYVPFQSTLKVHTIHITSNPKDTEDDEKPSRPTKIKIFSNRPNMPSFSDADSTPGTHEVVLSEKDWDPKTGTAKIELRFVKFQAVYNLVIFVVESQGDNEKVRIDRIRVIGETGEKRDGKIEKISQED